ncbi:MAG: hypothetical protein GXP16_14660 [Gammaproteobacteria bacterium]|nr:hypothetical protein [Gammaproteobacteria bacterium]
MSDLHIDEFYTDAAKILVSLFSVFPRPVTIYAADISGPDDGDEYGVHSFRYQACFATLVWLGEEGYLRYQDTIKQDAIDQAVLTSTCFSAMLKHSTSVKLDDSTLPPSVQAQQRTTIYQLQQAVDSKSTIEISAAFQTLLENMPVN